MDKDALRSLIMSSNSSKKIRKSNRIDDMLFGTLLDEQCRTALSVQKKYSEYLKPAKTKGHQKIKIEKESETEKVKNDEILHRYKDEILSVLRENSAVIIKGGTGAGKTTQIPKILLEILPAGKIIGCTQPRRAAAISVAERMKNELASRDIGYSVRFSAKKGEKIKYMTEGILLREIARDRNLDSYSIIILDEIHEKTVESLILLKYLLLLTRKRPDLKLVLMSATLEEDTMQEIGPYPVVEIESTKYPVEICYLNELPCDYIMSVVEKVLSVCSDFENILVFLTGLEDIKIVYNLLSERIKEYKLLIMHSRMSTNEQMSVIQEKGPKCILSTNITETSITIPDIKYVIDCGMCKHMVYDAVRNVKVMKIAPIQKVQAVQRAGRTGRTGEGVCCRMYTERAFNSLKKSSVSKLEMEDLEYFIFTSIQLELPISPHENVRAAINRMEKCKVVENFKLTLLGEKVRQLPLSVTHSIFLLEGKKNNCAWEVSVILSMIEVLSAQNTKLNELLDHSEAEQVRESDHLFLLHLYVREKSKMKSKMKINIQKADKILSQLCNIMHIKNESSGISKDVQRSVAKALITSHRHNLCMRIGQTYKEMSTGVECVISSSSLLQKTSHTVNYLVYNEIIEICRPVLNIVTKASFDEIKETEKS
ncbi:pre-mRNA-splicing factor ATP-dependent RNA helicase DHX38/PRP16 [Nematocida minor]|uniref:pre-mRNA-splicing factor ATP-dependent RNA helicase DHX38/PRP16 n=1 Tax=Nematocida minor TaxID=1912983 RepID=UPI002220F66C|nr:pre-mRNA-splicing factor ATP-dependent RNA helicase DHX38/PRP16 [Nematocida minor]KAI5192362.1 pre-mRNA-splicing factor ATP-dependent RNA helicase DHX38/PRP16 [Nematocida minor]